MFPSLKDIMEESDAKAHLKYSNEAMERKWDGLASILRVRDGKASLIGKGTLGDGSQQDYTEKFPEVVREGCKLFSAFNVSLLGEIVVLDNPNKENFNRVSTRTSRKKEVETYVLKNPATLIVYDILFYGSNDITHKTLLERKSTLENLFIDSTANKSDIIKLSKVWFTNGDKESNFKKMQEEKWEGVVFKGLKGAFGEEQFRYKPRFTTDVFWEGEIGREGRGKNKGLIGSLICYQYIDDEKMAVANVGGGLKDNIRFELTEMMRQEKVSKEKPIVIEVQTHKIMPSGKLRFPNFIRIRKDKTPEECIGHKLENKKIREPKLKEWL